MGVIERRQRRDQVGDIASNAGKVVIDIAPVDAYPQRGDIISSVIPIMNV